MECPKCGSHHLNKKGTRAGKQRYKCIDCSASFTEGVPYKEAIKYPPLNMTCPKCGSHQIIRDGHEKNKPRYSCLSCKYRFNDNSIYKLLSPIEWVCPYCGGPLSYSGYGKKGQRHYICHSCNKACSGDILTGEPIKRDTFRETNKNVHCISCNSLNLKKCGFSKGRQRYACLDCGRHFVENPEKVIKIPEVKEKIIKEILEGSDIHKIAEKYKYSYDHLRRMIRPYYKTEKISKEQISTIIKYGVYLRVPVDYLAEYIPCSRKKCRDIIEKYKKKLRT